MSGFARTIQRSAKRKRQFNGRGSRLGVVDFKAKDRLAREEREQRRAASRACTSDRTQRRSDHGKR